MNTDPVDPKLAAAQNYERLVVTYSMAPSTAILLEHAALRPGERVADVACGTGIVARQAAPVVGAAGRVVAVDINPAMLGVGRLLPPPAGAAIEWREGDAQALPLADATFNVVLCHHGLAFFPDGVAALREVYRVLAPGGRVCLAVWDVERSPVSHLIWSTISRHLDQPITTLARGFALGDTGTLEALLAEAGFQYVRVVTRMLTIRQPREDDMIEKILASVRGVAPWLAEMPADEVAALARSVEAEIGGALSEYVEGDQQLFPMSLHIASARK
ncbi:MAG: class I SAM-dependent methyltransferase [Ardenticatenaceae bacterium]|nr:class I SAM-dependent methyltransferase [Ardenticatenaceae bacterium]